MASLAAAASWQKPLAFLEGHRLLKPSTPAPLRSIFDQAWEELRRGYRNEYVYKNEIAGRLIFGKHSPRTAALHIELPVGRSIVDVAVFNGTSTAYEIKTEYDTSKRLSTQTENYRKVFEHVYVVTHPECAQSYLKLVDESVGVYALTQKGSLALLREAASNFGILQRATMFRCLQQAEYVEIIGKLTGLEMNLPNGLIATHCAGLFEALSTVEAHDFFVKAMRDRKSGLQVERFMSTLPQSLRALGYATPLSARQKLHLASALEKDIPFALV